MPFQKEKVLSSGVTGNYWCVSEAKFKMAGLRLSLVIELYKDNTPGLTPLGITHQIELQLQPSDLGENLITLVNAKVLAFADSNLPNINGVGTHKGCADLAGATVVS